MEFLLIMKRTESAAVNPEQEINLEKLGIEQLKNDSRTKQIFALGASSRGCCTIVDVSSAEQLTDYINANPLSLICNWEAHPLTATDQYVSTLNKMLKFKDILRHAA